MKPNNNFSRFLSYVLAPNKYTISKLSKYQKIEVQHVSRGCFHSSSHLYIFSGNKALIYDVSGIYEVKKRLGEIYLSTSDLAGLDNLLRYYSQKDKAIGCTTMDTVTIKIMIGSICVSKDIFTDNSCSVGSKKNIITFNSLLRRINPQSNEKT